MVPPADITDNDYRALAEFRYQIRKFLRFSESAARTAGLEPQQHQLLLAIRGLPEGTPATIGNVADRLQIQHHSTVELVDRLVRRGLVQRKRGGEDRRQVLLQVTAKGDRLLRELSIHHEEELRTNGPALIAALRRMLTVAKKGPKRAARTAGGARSGTRT
ncbi:MAG: MarR family winged helix-turn-helix transcriptional regulator [Terriglobales bacterium]